MIRSLIRNPRVIDRNHDKQVFGSRKLRVENFTDIIKIASNHVYKTTFKDLKKLQELKLCIKIQSTAVFLYISKATDFR